MSIGERIYVGWPRWPFLRSCANDFGSSFAGYRCRLGDRTQAVSMKVGRLETFITMIAGSFICVINVLVSLFLNRTLFA